MRLFSVVGISSSGKTTTIEHIIRELRQRGYSVGSVKEIHFQDFAIDLPGSNTHRHREAGSQLVTARGFTETDILFQRELSMEEILLHYDYDFVALEGVSELAVANIITAHTPQEVAERRSEHSFAVSGRLAHHQREIEGLPAYSVLEGEERLRELVDLVERKATAYRPPHSYALEGQPLSVRQNMLLSLALGRLQGCRSLCELDETSYGQEARR